MVNLVSTRIPRAISVKAVFELVCPQHVLVHGVVPSRCRTSHFLLLNLISLLTDQFFRPLNFHSTAAQPCDVSVTSPTFMWSLNFLEDALYHQAVH